MVVLTASGRNQHTSVYDAIHILTDAGYHAERIVGPAKFYNIFAWKNGRVICITVRSSKQAKLSNFRDHVSAISRAILTGSVPGEVQFWVYRYPEWYRWKVTSGGAIPIDQWDGSDSHTGVATA